MPTYYLLFCEFTEIGVGKGEIMGEENPFQHPVFMVESR
jgi:hypothetical protein